MPLVIKNLTKEKINNKELENIFHLTLKNLRIGGKIEISLVFCGDRNMEKLNENYRKKIGTTDVLSFSAREQADTQKRFILPENNTVYWGEIFISLPEAGRQSKKYHESLNKVLATLLIHGILHLAGYDHEKSKIAEKKMFKIQGKILKVLNF